MPQSNNTLLEYIVIKDLVARKEILDGNSLQSLCPLNDYVIEKYVTPIPSHGNFSYEFKIYNKQMIESQIKIGDWCIDNITTNNCFKPWLYIAFNLLDPKGNGSKDKKLPYNMVNHEYWRKLNVQDVQVGGADFEAINRMLELAKKACTFRSWYYFLEDTKFVAVKANYSKEVAKLQSLVSALQIGLDEFKNKLR